jgi:hypothetical protein
MEILMFKLLLTTVPILSDHSALGVDTLASLSEILSLIGTNHCTKVVSHRSKDVHCSMSLFALLVPIDPICKVACYISCNKRKLYCMLSSCFLSDISGTRNSLKLPKVRIVMSARRLPPFQEIFKSIYHFRSCGN